MSLRFISLVNGARRLISAINSSKGSIDNNKLIATNSVGKLSNSFLNSPQTGFALYDDFVFTSFIGWSTSVASGGAATTGNNGSNNRFGIANLSTGNTSASGRASLFMTAKPFLFGNSEIIYFSDVLIETLSTPTDTFNARFGFGDSATADSDNGTYFQCVGTNNEWVCKTSNNTNVTTTNTGIIATTDWVSLSIKVTNLEKVEYYFNNVLVATHTTNISTNTLSIKTSITKAVGTSIRRVLVDFIACNANFTTPRGFI